MISVSTKFVDAHGARRGAGAAADHEDFFRRLRNQRGEMAEHPLQAHVLRLARRLHFSGVVVVHHVAEPRDGDRRAQPFADVEDVPLLPHPRGRVPAVGDENAWNRRNGSNEEGRNAQRNHEHRRRHPSQHSFPPRRGWRRAELCRREQEQSRHARYDHQHLLRALRSEPIHENEARDDRPEDGADSIGGVDAAHETSRVFPSSRHGGQRQRKARAPQNRPGQHGPERAHEIELEVVPDAGRDRRVDGPVRQRFHQHVRAPRHRADVEQLAPAQRDARTLDGLRDNRPEAAANAEADEKHREDQRERVGRCAEQQAQHARPDDLRGQRTEP